MLYSHVIFISDSFFPQVGLMLYFPRWKLTFSSMDLFLFFPCFFPGGITDNAVLLMLSHFPDGNTLDILLWLFYRPDGNIFNSADILLFTPFPGGNNFDIADLLLCLFHFPGGNIFNNADLFLFSPFPSGINSILQIYFCNLLSPGGPYVIIPR